MIRRTAIATLACVAAIATGCAQKPKESYVDRVRAVCGPEVAQGYASVKWRNRDYAQDSLLVSCLAFGRR